MEFFENGQFSRRYPSHDPYNDHSGVQGQLGRRKAQSYLERNPILENWRTTIFFASYFWYNLQGDYLVCFIFYLSCQNLEFWSSLTHKGIQFQFQIVFQSIQFQMSAYCILRTIPWILIFLNMTLEKKRSMIISNWCELSSADKKDLICWGAIELASIWN